jgi:hypothetical protein
LRLVGFFFSNPILGSQRPCAINSLNPFASRLLSRSPS